MFKIKWLFVPAALASISFFSVSAAKAENPPCFTLAALEGSWSVVATYGANVAVALGQTYVDKSGSFTGVYVLNGPTAGDPNGARTVSTGTQTGSFTINCDGTGVRSRILTSSLGVVTTQMDNFMITGATVKNGVFIATSLADAQQTPSALVAGGVFVTRVHTRLPDRPGPTQP